MMMYVLGLIFMLYQESSPPQAQPEREGESAQEILQKVEEAYRALESHDSFTLYGIDAPEMEDMGTLAAGGHYLSIRRSDDLLVLRQEGGIGLRWKKGKLACWHSRTEQRVLYTIEAESLSYSEIDRLSSRLQPRVSWTIPLLSMELPFLLGEDLEAIIPNARISYIDRDHPEMEMYKEMARFRGIRPERGDPVPIHVLRLENDRFDLHLVIRQTDFLIAGFLLKTTLEGFGGCTAEPITVRGMMVTDDIRFPERKLVTPEGHVEERLEGGVSALIETLEDCSRKSMQERKGELREQIESMREQLEAMEENHSDRERYECQLERMTRFLASLDRKNEPSNY